MLRAWVEAVAGTVVNSSMRLTHGMAITFQLQMDEGVETEGSTPDAHRKELKYFAHVTDGEDHAAVRAAAKTDLPSTYFNLVRQSVTVPRRITFDTIFEVIVEYKHPGNIIPRPMESGDVRTSVRSEGGASVNVQFSHKAVRLVPNGVDPLKLDELHKRVIGLQDDGSVAGVEIEANAIMLTVEAVKPGTLVSPSYLLSAAASKGKVNLFPYKGFPTGSLRLMAFDASQRLNPDPGDGTIVPDWNLNFAFHFSPPVSGKIPMYEPPADEQSDGVWSEVPFYKEGHHYLDIYKENLSVERQDGKDDYAFPVALWATIHQIYEYEDFETLLSI